MKKLILELNENNLKVMMDYCKQFNINCYVIDDNNNNKLPKLTNQTTPTSTKNNNKKFPEIKDSNKATIGNFVTIYPTFKAVRYWESKFTPDKVKFGIKKSLQEAGAKWNAELGAYDFSTKKAFDAWVKAQKNRA